MTADHLSDSLADELPCFPVGQCRSCDALTHQGWTVLVSYLQGPLIRRCSEFCRHWRYWPWKLLKPCIWKIITPDHYLLLCSNLLDLVLCSISIDLVVAYSYLVLSSLYLTLTHISTHTRTQACIYSHIMSYISIIVYIIYIHNKQLTFLFCWLRISSYLISPYLMILRIQARLSQ